MSLKITHIIPDDKFPNMAHKTFESVYPGKNEFVIFTNKEQLIYSKSINPKKIKRINLFFKLLIRKYIVGDIVVFHSINNDSLKIIEALPKSKKIIWIGWGFDYYDLINKKLLKEKTLQLKNNNIKENILVHHIKKFIKRFVGGRDRKERLIGRINIFSPVIYEDFELLVNSLPNLKLKYMSWNYGTLEDDHIRGFEDKSINGNNILLGNSATYTNNHLDAFLNIKKININGRKIITPLSYGDKNYREIIASEGHKNFGNNFHPLMNFMDVDEYIALLQSCSIVIMNHLRQQALGNIIISLYMGAKVFLDKDNPVYLFFRKRNAYIYLLDDLDVESKTLLKKEQIDYNRKVIREYWERDVIHKKTQEIIEMALNI